VGYRVWGSKRVTVQEPWVAGYGEARGLRLRSRGLQATGLITGFALRLEFKVQSSELRD